MKLQSERDIVELIQNDQWMMSVLHHAKSLELPDCWVCAGFVRTKIWDVLHHFNERTKLADVDVIYYDPSCTDEVIEKELEQRLLELDSTIPWSVKNEARMHLINEIPPYESSIDAISKFPETATALGVRLDKEDNVILTAPHGVEDVLQLIVKPTPYFAQNKQQMTVYEQRIIKKNWKATWGKVSYEVSDRKPDELGLL